MAKNFYLDRGNIFSRLMFISATSPLVRVQVCFKSFLFIIFLSCPPG